MKHIKEYKIFESVSTEELVDIFSNELDDDVEIILFEKPPGASNYNIGYHRLSYDGITKVGYHGDETKVEFDLGYSIDIDRYKEKSEFTFRITPKNKYLSYNFGAIPIRLSNAGFSVIRSYLVGDAYFIKCKFK
jgi:hypothetical protein